MYHTLPFLTWEFRLCVGNKRDGEPRERAINPEKIGRISNLGMSVSQNTSPVKCHNKKTQPSLRLKGDYQVLLKQDYLP